MPAPRRPKTPKQPLPERTSEQVAREAFRNRVAEGEAPERDAAPDRLGGS